MASQTSGAKPRAQLTNASSSFRGFAPPPDAVCGGAAEAGVRRLCVLVGLNNKHRASREKKGSCKAGVIVCAFFPVAMPAQAVCLFSGSVVAGKCVYAFFLLARQHKALCKVWGLCRWQGFPKLQLFQCGVASRPCPTTTTITGASSPLTMAASIAPSGLDARQRLAPLLPSVMCSHHQAWFSSKVVLYLIRYLKTNMNYYNRFRNLIQNYLNLHCHNLNYLDYSFLQNLHD